jgi:hypothetical protein
LGPRLGNEKNYVRRFSGTFSRQRCQLPVAIGGFALATNPLTETKLTDTMLLQFLANIPWRMEWIVK